jgi:hypothetical protein
VLVEHDGLILVGGATGILSSSDGHQWTRVLGPDAI